MTMRSLSVDEFLDEFGTNLTIARASSLTGLNANDLLAKARELKFVFSAVRLRPYGFEHLPALPAHAIARTWERGTYYRLKVEGMPGINSITVHNASTPFEDRLLKKDHDDISSLRDSDDNE